MKSPRYVLFAIAAVSFSLAAYLSIEQEQPQPEPVTIKITPYKSTLNSPETSAPTQKTSLQAEKPDLAKVHYIVKVGDSLSTIFNAWDLSYNTLQSLLEADLNSLKLDTIKPGDHLEMVIDRTTNQLKQLTYHESLVERAVYKRLEDGSYSYEFIEEQGEWKTHLFSGEVVGSFSSSAHKAGLTITQIANITRVLRDKINFAKDFRAGDTFNILVNEQYLRNHLTGNTEIQGISITIRGKEVAAFLAEDGRFYDREGNSLEQAFDRYPVAKPYRRITSPFNPRRVHPVTGRISPHNGTDFATPVGTPVHSTGDGKVVAVRNHPYAGKYLVIEHNSVYKTRYLHLQRILVKRGDHVKRGQKVALSGATGRLTGPHLHFEVLVRNRAVDPITANLPMATSIPAKDKPAFIARISEFDQLVGNKDDSRIAQEKRHV
ncbi:peptidoglycan DD-metalloendopeptidase family protein [Vibrio mediterranei]|uniref:peptidoglycan DD-metalloendopeptidase family protein n=1 Tax=Vibrio mediterranei TaxID=689 RepID=UPI00148DE78C|nr:peptidoglycan DD-metalloendopeptidase family protein [Vibrio mediterranei]NOI24533.1 peptidoglycan DD-metalloendopeptidase family protein [Vibrio mediterranei]